MYEEFERLMRERGENFSDVARAVGGRPSTFTDWRAGRSEPSAKKLYAIATHFGVSMEYLLTGNSPASESSRAAVDGIPLSASEVSLVRKYRTVPPDKQKGICALLDIPGEKDAQRSYSSPDDARAIG